MAEFTELIKKVLGPVDAGTVREFEKMMGFLNPESEADRLQVIEMLGALYGLEKKELAVVTKEVEKLTEDQKAEAVAREARAERVKAIIKELRARTGAGYGKHPLAGMMGGPTDAAEGGTVVTKQADTGEALQILLDAIRDGQASARVSDHIKVLSNLDGSFFRVVFYGFKGPKGFDQQGTWPIFAQEATYIADAARLLAEAMAFEKSAAIVGQERRGHPLQGFAGSQPGPGVGFDVLTK